MVPNEPGLDQYLKLLDREKAPVEAMLVDEVIRLRAEVSSLRTALLAVTPCRECGAPPYDSHNRIYAWGQWFFGGGPRPTSRQRGGKQEGVRSDGDD